MIKQSDIKVVETTEDKEKVFDNLFQSSTLQQTKPLFVVPSIGFEGVWSAGETIELEIDTQ